MYTNVSLTEYHDDPLSEEDEQGDDERYVPLTSSLAWLHFLPTYILSIVALPELWA